MADIVVSIEPAATESVHEEDHLAIATWGLRAAGYNVPDLDGPVGQQLLGTHDVRLPGDAALNAGHNRAPVAGQQNWIPTGPRNFVGRVRALAIHPSNERIVFAGSATGGVWKTENAGETWFPLWHDEESLAVGAMAVHHRPPASVDTTVVWVATGEPQPNGIPVPGAGVFRSPDNGVNFARVATPGQLNGSTSFEAIAVHPNDPGHCWVVGDRGVFRTVDAGVHWDGFDLGRPYSDVAFGAAAPPAPAEPFVLYLVRRNTAGGDIIRIDQPTAPAGPGAGSITAQIAAAANLAQPIPAPPLPVLAPPGAFTATSRAKFTVCRDSPNIAFVVYVAPLPHVLRRNPDHIFYVMLRCTNANVRPSFAASVWTALPPDADFWLAGQGSYALLLAVSPTNPDHLAFGMFSLHISRDARAAIPPGPTWQRSTLSDLFPLDRGHHEDQHAVAFEQNRALPAVPALWDAHDGGISFNNDYHVGATVFYPKNIVPAVPGPGFAFRALNLPLVPQPTHRWTLRSHGMANAQMFDITQSPVVPSMYGCGLLDLGSYFTSGGPSWRYMLAGDGGFIAFDRNDPYRMFFSDVNGVAEIMFAGGNQARIPSPADPIRAIQARFFREGFPSFDATIPVSDLQIHPRKSHRLVYLRRNRAYGTTDAENWTSLPVGAAVQVILTADFGFPGAALPREGYFQFDFTADDVAQRLGFTRPVVTNVGTTIGPAAARRRSYGTDLISAPGPFALRDGDQLTLNVAVMDPNAAAIGTASVIIRFSRAAFVDIGRAEAAEVAAAIMAQIRAAPPVIAGVAFGALILPVFLIAPWSVELETARVGPGSSISIRGTAAPLLGLTAGDYHSTVAGVPAALGLMAQNAAAGTLPFPDINVTGQDLRIGVDGGAAQPVDLTVANFADPTRIRANELAAAIERAGIGAGLRVRVIAGLKQLVLVGNRPGGFGVAGSALAALGVPAPPGANVTALPLGPAPAGTYDLRPVPAAPGVPLRLSLTPPGRAVMHLDFAAANFVSLQRATVEEVRREITNFLATVPIPPADLRCVPIMTVVTGAPTEITYSLVEPDTLWVGSLDGRVHRSTDDGAKFRDVSGPAFLRRGRKVEAIAPHPADARTAYVGLYGPGTPVATDPGFLFKTSDAGDTWIHVGAQIRDTAGNLLGVNAIEIDPAAPDHVFVATDAGVFRSDNGGTDWREYSQGLPNSIIVDMTFVPATRTLRCGVWGRGTFERHVGDVAATDRHIYVRASLLDDGARRPSPDGPDTFAVFPLPSARAESPDIKNSPFRPPEIGADDVVDSAEFDEVILHEEPVEGASNLFVQVHNRGSFPAPAVRITAMWADASLGPPPLTDAFWTSYNAGGALAVPAAWTLIGNVVLAGQLVVGYPRVATLPVVWPASIGSLDEIGILVLVSSTDDPLTSRVTDVNTLLAGSPKAAYRVTATRRLADAREIHLVATSAAGFKVTPAGTAQARLGLATRAPADAAVQFQRSAGGVVGAAGAPGTFNLTGIGPPASIQIDDGTNRTTIVFGPPDVAALADATAAEIRRAINRQLRLGRVQVRAVIGRTDFAIGASSTDEGARPLAVSATHLADLIVRAPAEPAAAWPGLFELIARVTPDRITRGVDNFFYVRVRNRGDAAAGNARYRLYFLTFPAAAPAHVAEVVHAAEIAAGDSAIEQLTWNPAPIPAADPFAVMLATVDSADRDPLVFPAGGFANLDAVHAFCRTTNNAVYRVIPVA